MKKEFRIRYVYIAGIIVTLLFAIAVPSYASASLSKPSNVTAVLTSKSEAKVSWKKVSNAQKYSVYYSTTGSNYKLLKTTTLRYVKHSGLYAGKTYYYKVRAIKGTKKSAYSTVKKVRTLSKASPGLTASASSNKVTLKWDSVKNASGYYVYRKGTNGYIRITATTSRLYKDNSRDIGTTYTYKVVPYIKNNGKVFLGTASIKSVTTGNSGYLMDLVKPYKYPYNYHDYSKTVFNMGGVGYSHGFSCMGYCTDYDDYGNAIGNEVYFNLRGKYKTVSFISGMCDESQDDNNAKVYIYKDGDLILHYEIKYNQLPKKYSVNVTDCMQFKIVVDSGRSTAMYDSDYGFADIVVTK
ncbi:MAG: fibronectin type III domain-containing protein [Lentihominibacter sp.]